jgi:hypothetical protein
MKVIGKDENALSSLKEKLQSMPVPIKKKLKVRALLPDDDFSPEDDFFNSKPKKAKPVPKAEKDLNCKDLYFVFVKFWREYNFPGRCPFWTGKDLNYIKRMIAEQGVEAVTEYLKYSLHNWKDICHRYKIMSVCPTIPILYGYRGSLLPESLDPTKKPTHTGAEYTETDIPSGSWG